MDDYLSKPYTQMQLREMVLKWLPGQAPGQCQARPGSASPEATSQPAASCLTTNLMGENPRLLPAVNLKALADIRALQRPHRPNVLASILRKYLDNSRGSVDALRDAIRANNPAALQAVAHRLKSSSAQLGAVALAARCQELETMGSRKNLIDADHILAQLQTDYLAACTVFRNEIAKGKQP